MSQSYSSACFALHEYINASLKTETQTSRVCETMWTGLMVLEGWQCQVNGVWRGLMPSVDELLHQKETKAQEYRRGRRAHIESRLNSLIGLQKGVRDFCGFGAWSFPEADWCLCTRTQVRCTGKSSWDRLMKKKDRKAELYLCFGTPETWQSQGINYSPRCKQLLLSEYFYTSSC